MRRLLLVVVCLVLARSATADTIQLTSGALIYPSPFGAEVHLSGDQGFTFDAITLDSNYLRLKTMCLCVPGFAADLRAVWVGSDAFGTGTLNGATFTADGGFVTNNSMSLDFQGSVLLPASGLEHTIVAAPFLFTGFFAYLPTGASAYLHETLLGGGTATIGLTQGPINSVSRPDSSWLVTSVRYDFVAPDAVPTPIPEPSSLVLIGSAWLARRYRRH